MILICGGAGYIGSVCNYHLIKKGFKTIVLDDLSTGHSENIPGKCMFYKGSLGDKDLLREIFQENEVDCVFHFAALSIVKDSVSNPMSYYENNVLNTINLLSVMEEFKIRKFVFSSSAAVYGYPDNIPIEEKAATIPVNPYGKTKKMVEDILGDCDKAYGLKSICLRYFNACGADTEGQLYENHDPETHLIPLVLQAVTGERENVSIFGEDYSTPDGTCVRDYIHVTDIADAHILAYQYLKKENKSEIINLGNGEGYSVREVIETVKRVTGSDFPVISSPRRPSEPEQLVACSDKALLYLGWEPFYTTLSSIIESVVTVMREKGHKL